MKKETSLSKGATSEDETSSIAKQNLRVASNKQHENAMKVEGSQYENSKTSNKFGDKGN